MNPSTYESIIECYANRCVECFTSNNVEVHHKLSNSKSNRRQYKLYIDSVFNLVTLCGKLEKDCHEKFKHKYKVSYREADMFEEYLENLTSLNK